MEKNYNVELKVNDTDIPIKDFVQKIFINVLLGLVKTLSLKGIKTIETIEVKLEAE